MVSFGMQLNNRADYLALFIGIIGKHYHLVFNTLNRFFHFVKT